MEIKNSKNMVESYEIYMKNKNEELNDEIKKFKDNYVTKFKIREKFDIEIFGLYIFFFLQRDYLYEYTELKINKNEL